MIRTSKSTHGFHPSDESQRTFQMATFSVRNYFAECSLVSSLPFKLSQFRRDDVRERVEGRSLHYRALDMINKGQVEEVSKKDVLGQKKFVESLFGIAV